MTPKRERKKIEPPEISDTFARGLALIDEALRVEQPDWRHLHISRWRDRYDVNISHDKPVKSRPKYLWYDVKWVFPRRGLRQNYLPKKA